MNFIDEEELEMQKIKSKKMKKMIIILIILLVVLCVIAVSLIVYRVYHPVNITTYIDGVRVSDFDTILDFQTDENGQTQIYIPIRDFATYLNSVNKEFEYESYKGDYEPKTEDDSKCYVIRPGYEVAVYSESSKDIYKLNLQDGSEDYIECNIDKDVFSSNGKLYTSVDGIEQGYNVYFSYDEAKKVITIYTLDYLISTHTAALEGVTIGDYGEMTIDGNYSNWKSLFDGLLVVEASTGGYGIIKTDDYTSFVLEPQYDNIEFIPDSSTFLVESDGKIGLFSEEGKRKIDLIYDNLTLMSRESNLYVVENEGQFGVVDENGNIIIYPEYEDVGIDVGGFSYNGIKNGYILLDKLIPVQQENKWAFFDTSGNMISNGFIYENIGCQTNKGNNTYSLLEIPDYNVIVVGDELGKYSFMDISGNDTILPFVFDEIYIKLSAGEASYWMTYNNQEYEVLQYLK